MSAQQLPAGRPRQGSDSGPRLERATGTWTFLSNHGHVLLCVAAEPHQTLPSIAEQVGITSRAVQLILADLIDGGYVERIKIGRRNHYQIHPEGRLRHPLESHHSIADLIAALGPPWPDAKARAASSPPRNPS